MGLLQRSRKKAGKSNRTDLLSFSLIERLKLFFKIKHQVSLDFPRQFWIEITNKCNLRCIMCPVSIGLNRKAMDMDMEAFRNIIDKICILKPRIMLHVAGEPLLNKNVFRMIEYAKNKGCWIGMHTNAALLSKEISIRILESSLNFIFFSFDGFTAEVYEKVRAGAKFDKVKLQIEEFLKLRHERRAKAPFTQIGMLVMEETETQVSKFYKYWRSKKVDKVGSKLAGTWSGLIGEGDLKRVWRFGHSPCRDVFLKCAILVDGTVVPCCNDIQGRLPLGNILRQSFKEIWQGEQYSRLRNQHLQNTIPENSICHNCAFRRSWSRCEQITQWIIKQIFWRKDSIENQKILIKRK